MKKNSLNQIHNDNNNNNNIQILRERDDQLMDYKTVGWIKMFSCRPFLFYVLYYFM